MPTLLVALSDSTAARAAAAFLAALPAQLRVLVSESELEAAMAAGPADVVVTGAWGHDADVAGWVGGLLKVRPGCRVILVHGAGASEATAAALQRGAFDVLPVPLVGPDVVARVGRALSAGTEDAGGRVAELQRSLSDLSEELRREKDARRVAEGALLKAAIADPLTGLLNRRVFLERLRSEQQRARRFGRALSVVMVDVDNADRIEKRFGSATLQDVIRQMGDYLREGLRETDTAARTDDDEFGLVLPETPLGGARELAAGLRRALGSQNYGPAGRVTVSLGVVELDAGLHPDAHALLEATYAALKRAKAAGRDRVES